MIKINLTEQEKKELISLRNKRDSNIGERAWFVLLNAEGKSTYQIAQQTGRHRLTVNTWLKRYQENGVEGLYNIPPPGRPPEKAELIKAEINELLSKTADEYGYPEANWTISLLIDYFEKKFISVSDKTLLRVIKSEGWCYKRLSKVPPKDGPTSEEKQARIAEITSSINKDKIEAEQVTILFEDESHLSIQPYVQRGWCKIGEKTKVATSKKKESCTLFGALNFETGKCYWKIADKGNSNVFISFLHQLHQSFPVGTIVLILDNASIHKSKKIKEFLSKNKWIKIYHITAYSPELNPIERFWGWLKSKIYGKKSFSNLKALLEKVRKLMWHYNEKRLITEINFSFKMYDDLA